MRPGYKLQSLPSRRTMKSAHRLPSHARGAAAVDHILKFVDVTGMRIGAIQANQPLRVERVEGLIERLHAELLLAQLHGRINLVNLILPNEVPNGRVWNQNLHRHDAALPIRSGQQRLAQDALQNHRELGANLGLLIRREDIDNAGNGGGSGIGMQRREGKMPRLGYPERRLDGFEIPHFADQHNVRILAQCGAQRVGK